MKQIITGFHAIEEKIRRAADEVEKEQKNKKQKNNETEKNSNVQMTIHVSKIGPRVKKILDIAKVIGATVVNSDNKNLDSLVKSLPEVARDHRGIVLEIEGDVQHNQNDVNFDQWILEAKASDEKKTVLILDSITDPHNVGAILRSCDQFGASLVVMPSRHSANDYSENEIIARSSAGASAYVPVAVVSNLVRATQMLKDAGFWVYGADAGGVSVQKIAFAQKTAIVMGSEGNGIAKLLEEQCDTIVSIPTCGKIDSLNVSVAAGVLLYERHRQVLEA